MHDRDSEGYAARLERERKHRDQIAELEEAIPLPLPPDQDITRPGHLDLSEEAEFTNERIDRLKRALQRAKSDTADRILKALGSRPPNERLTRIETRLKIVLLVLAAIGTAALGALVTVAQGLYHRGEEDGVMQTRVQQLEHRLEQFEQLFPFANQRHP